jgi:hypothetical protein
LKNPEAQEAPGELQVVLVVGRLRSVLKNARIVLLLEKLNKPVLGYEFLPRHAPKLLRLWSSIQSPGQ